MNITLLAVDLAKNKMQLHGEDKTGKVVLQKAYSRAKFEQFIQKMPRCTVAMEACGGANYWGRKLQSYGHQVKLIHPSFVKPFLKGNKNDVNDAQAISDAAQKKSMRFVAIKSIEQQDIQTLHRIRSQYIKSRTGLVNQIRGLLAEYGVVIPKQIQQLDRHLPTILDDETNTLTAFTRELLQLPYQQLKSYHQAIDTLDKKIEAIAKRSASCQTIMKIEGVGPISATAILTHLVNTKAFKCGREFAAFLGLVPRQHATGGKTTLLGISKRGDKYMRTLLIHGARAVVSRSAGKTDKRSLWINPLKARRGFNKACVALANKNARIIWALLDKKTDYNPAGTHLGEQEMKEFCHVSS